MAWAEFLPAPARRELVPRLRSDDNYEFLGAFWELYLAEVLRRCGYGPEFHPAVEDSSRRPDFRAVASNPFLLEGTLASPSTAERAAQRRLDTLYDLLDRTPSDAFFLDIEVNAVGSRAPSATALRQAVERWLATIDPDAIIDAGVTLDVLDSHALRWQRDDWDVVVRPLPKSASQRGDAADPLVGISSRALRPLRDRHRIGLHPRRRVRPLRVPRRGDPPEPAVCGARHPSQGPARRGRASGALHTTDRSRTLRAGAGGPRRAAHAARWRWRRRPPLLPAGAALPLCRLQLALPGRRR